MEFIKFSFLFIIILFIGIKEIGAIKFTLNANSEKCLTYDFNQDDIVSGTIEVTPFSGRHIQLKVRKKIK